MGIAIFFITGRADTLRDPTENNLHNAAYKSAARAAIVQQGYHIILSVGDQFSDLKGTPAADYSVKLPNPFYYIP